MITILRTLSKPKVAVLLISGILFAYFGHFFVAFALTEKNKTYSEAQKDETFSGSIIDTFFSAQTSNSPHLLNLSDIKVFPEKNDALVTFNVSDSIIGHIYYNTNTPVNPVSDPWISPSSYSSFAASKGHLRHLKTGTVYYYVIVIKDYYGNTVQSDEQTFTTLK